MEIINTNISFAHISVLNCPKVIRIITLCINHPHTYSMKDTIDAHLAALILRGWREAGTH